MRVTIVMEDAVDKELRQLQAKLIKKTNATVSFSSVVNQQLKKSLK